MSFTKFVLLFAALTWCVGCGSSEPAAPPEMTETLRAEIEAEDAAIEDAERNNQ